MKRVALLVALLTAGSVSVAIKAYQQAPVEPSANALQAEKLKDNLWVLKGAGSGGNTAVFVTATGVVIVDSKNPGWGQPIIEKVRELTDKPITMVINTHTHYDHVSGNIAMPATVEIVAHEYTAKRLPAFTTVTGRGETENVFKANPGKGLPKRTFTDKLTIGSGADQINLYHTGPAHTGGDAFVEFVALRVMHTGDAFARKGVPLIDKDNGGSGVQFAATIRKAAEAGKNADTIINGHTPAQTTLADMREFADFMADFVAHVQAAKKAGQTAEQAITSWKTPEKYKGYSSQVSSLMGGLPGRFQLLQKELK